MVNPAVQSAIDAMSLDEAPVEWSRVELRDGVDDKDPTVLHD